MININPLFSNNLNKDLNYFENRIKETNKKEFSQQLNPKLKKLKEAAIAFETIMVNQMFKSMKKNILQSNLIKENQASKIFKDFLTTEESQIATKNMRFGLAKSIYEQNIKYIK